MYKYIYIYMYIYIPIYGNLYITYIHININIHLCIKFYRLQSNFYSKNILNKNYIIYKLNIYYI